MPNNQVLRAVREQRGLNIADVASFASISLQRLTSFEEGKREPSRKQMERLAEIYGVPLYSLYAQGIPNLPPLPRDFRKPDPSPAALSPKGMTTLWSSVQISHFTFQLSVELKFEAPDLVAGVNTAQASRRWARDFRAAFDEWRKPREERLHFSGSPEQRFLSALRLFFEVQGGVLNINDAPPEDYMGFFLKPEGGMPTIFVNRAVQSKKAQLFTLAHECAHWLIGADGISNPFWLRNTIERSCNVFAAEFLAPMDQFSRIVESLPARIRESTADFIHAASARSLLSKHATAIRLAEGGYLSQAQLRKWEHTWRKSPRTEKEEEKSSSDTGTGGNPHAKRISELGHLPVFLAYKAVKAGLIDRYDVTAGIGLSERLQERAYSLAARRLDIALG